MSLGTAQLSESLQMLIDTRLDTIDRMLLGRVPRQDRLSIVKEVESQLFELLHERDAEELTREDVLGVLARLDPPEAYLPEADEESSAVRAAAGSRVNLPARTPKKKVALAKASGILGLSAVGTVLLSPLVYLLGALLEAEILLLVCLFGAVFATFTMGLLAIVLGVIGRRGGVWAVVGMITGGLSLLMSIPGGFLLLLNM